MAIRSKAAARLLGSRVRIPQRAWMFVSCVGCVLCNSSHCDVLITRSEGFLFNFVSYSNLHNGATYARFGPLRHWGGVEGGNFPDSFKLREEGAIEKSSQHNVNNKR